MVLTAAVFKMPRVKLLCRGSLKNPAESISVGNPAWRKKGTPGLLVGWSVSSSPDVCHWKSAPQSLKRLCPLWYDNCLVCVTLPAEMVFPCVSAQGYGFL